MTRSVILVFAFSLLLACSVSAMFPVAERPELDTALARGRDLVLTIAESGPGVLSDPAVRAEIRTLAAPSPLFVLLGAWSELSIGRVGLLPLDAAARLPWLVVAALGSAALFVIVRRAASARLAWLSCAWLLALPGWVTDGARAGAASTLASLWLLAFAFYLSSLPRASRRPGRYAALATAAFAIGIAETRAMLGALLPMLAHFAFVNRALARRFEQKNLLLVPNAAALCVAIVPIAFIAFNPGLYGADVAAVVARVFAPFEAADFRVSVFVLPAIAAACAWAVHRLAQRYASLRIALAVEVSAVALVALASAIL